MSEWEPKIVAFLCNWCSYAGADLAGPVVAIGRLPPAARVPHPGSLVAGLDGFDASLGGAAAGMGLADPLDDFTAWSGHSVAVVRRCRGCVLRSASREQCHADRQ